MKTVAACAALSCCLLAACNELATQPAVSPVTEKLIELSGASAHDCGIFPLNTNLDTGWNCAVDNDGDSRPFWLAVQTQGIDSDAWRAIGRDKFGKRYVLTYDSNPRGGPDLDPKFTVDACAGNFEWAREEPYVLGCSPTAP